MQAAAPVVTFVVCPADRQDRLWTSADYVRHIVEGLRAHGVAEDYVWRVIRKAVETNRSASDTDRAGKEINDIRHLRGLLLSPHYGIRHWRELNFVDESEWWRAIDIVEDRIRERFIRWADELSPKEAAGFAVMALDCLFLETPYGFQTGASTYDTRRAYTAVLSAAPFGLDPAIATGLYENVRNGIVHDTETRKGWKIRMGGQAPIVERDGASDFILNRTSFHEALKGAFDAWMVELRGGDVRLRGNMRARMEQIIGKHYSA